MDATQTKTLLTSTTTLLTTPFDGGPEAVINHFGRTYPDLVLPHHKHTPEASDHSLVLFTQHPGPGARLPMGLGVGWV